MTTPNWRVAALAAIGVLVRLLLVGGARPALFWDSASFLERARDIGTNLHPGPLGLRPPGYPLFLLATSGSGTFLEGTVFVQQLLGLAGMLLAYLILARLVSGRVIPFAGASTLSLMPDLLFMEVTIYSETLALFLVTLAGWAMVSCRTAARSPVRLTILGTSVALATITRPITLVLVPLAMVAAIPSGTHHGGRRRKGRWSHVIGTAVLACYLPILLITGGLLIVNGFTAGRLRIANGMGFSSLNYLGYPELHVDLPPPLDWISRSYERLDRDRPAWLPYTPWRQAVRPLMEARKARGLPTSDEDRAALDTTLRAVRARPLVYLRLWARTFRNFWSTYRVQYGFWRNQHEFAKQAPPQVGPHRRWAVRHLERTLRTLMPVIGWLCLLFPLVLTIERRFAPGRSATTTLWLWWMVVSASLANTAIEPALGQFRYRMIWTPLIMVVAACTVDILVRTAIHAVRRSPGEAVVS